MRRMTIGARRGELEIEGRRLAVECVAVTWSLLSVTIAAVVDHLHVEIAKAQRCLEVRNCSVARGAGRGFWVSFLKCLAMTAEVIVRYVLGVTFRTHQFGIGPVHRRR